MKEYKDYIVYKCRVCGCEFILHVDQVKWNTEGGNYISCPLKGHKNVVVAGAYDDIKECMSHSSYKRDKGSIKQIK